jgi:hypothetical protein
MHRDLIKKLILMEFSLLGECKIVEMVSDQTHGVPISEAEMAEVQSIYDEAYSDWLLRMAGAEV